MEAKRLQPPSHTLQTSPTNDLLKYLHLQNGKKKQTKKTTYMTLHKSMNPEKAICGLQSSLITLTCIIGSRGGHTRLKTLVLERSLVSQGKALQP